MTKKFHPKNVRFNIEKSITIIHHTLIKQKIKHNMITSIDVGKAFVKIQNPSMIKTFNKLEGNTLNLIKGSMKNPQLTLYLVVKD